MKLLKLPLIVAALALLGGCVAVPVGPGYYGGGYGEAYSGPPAPVYYGAPYYYGPSIGIGVYGGGYRGYGYRRHY